MVGSMEDKNKHKQFFYITEKNSSIDNQRE
jgi:hypothetical protein